MLRKPKWWADRGARLGIALLSVITVAGVGASFLAPYSPRAQDRESFHHPPSLPSAGCSVSWLVADKDGATHLFGFQGCRVYLLGYRRSGKRPTLEGAPWSAGECNGRFTWCFAHRELRRPRGSGRGNRRWDMGSIVDANDGALHGPPSPLSDSRDPERFPR